MIRLDPSDLDDLHCYKLLSGVMVPRPIAFITSVNVNGVLNAAPFSWSTVASLDPLILVFAPCQTPDRVGFELDTFRNVEATGEFVWNVVTADIERRMVECSASWPPEVDELEVTGLATVSSNVVEPPRLLESPVSFECKLECVMRIGSGDCALMLGRVVRIHVDSAFLAAGSPDAGHDVLVGRMGGIEYVRTADTFSLSDIIARDEGSRVTDYVYE